MIQVLNFHLHHQMMQKYIFLIIIIHRTATIFLHFSIDATLVTEKCLFCRYLPPPSLCTLSDDFYPITSDLFGAFWTPQATLKSNVVYGRSLMVMGH